MKQFDFGENWRDFSENALTPERVRNAREQFAELVADLNLKGRTFLDIGFGQGLGLLSATVMGANTVGCDINPKCAMVLEANRRYFPEIEGKEIPVVVGSILDDSVVAKVRAMSVSGNGYDIVHSWGVLHHTGDMRRAIRNAASLVLPSGHLILAIYNRHWSSRPWLAIKWLYNVAPPLLKKAMIGMLYPVIYFAKWIVTGKPPKQQPRGMDFYYDVVDWVGGYPYEYGSLSEIAELMKGNGYQLLKAIPAEVPTGCNQFVFRRTGSMSS